MTDEEKTKEKKYRINFKSLSNDKLLELWLAETLHIEDTEKVKQILKERKVIKEVARD